MSFTKLNLVTLKRNNDSTTTDYNIYKNKRISPDTLKFTDVFFLIARFWIFNSAYYFMLLSTKKYPTIKTT